MRFTKMQGLGNDFVVIDGTQTAVSLSPSFAQRLADRHLGIGCDQILLIEPATDGVSDFLMRIFNADGSEVQHCGNGVRCVARYIEKNALSQRSPLQLQVGVTTVTCTVDGEQVVVDMGAPNYALHERDQIDVQALTCHLIDMGNPHAVIFTDQLPEHWEQLGAAIGSDPFFLEGVNVGFGRIINPEELHVQVFERGSGATQACGTGATAAAAAGMRLGQLAQMVKVVQPGGALWIRQQPDGRLEMIGPAQFVFTGVLAEP